MEQPAAQELFAQLGCHQIAQLVPVVAAPCSWWHQVRDRWNQSHSVLQTPAFAWGCSLLLALSLSFLISLSI